MRWLAWFVVLFLVPSVAQAKLKLVSVEATPGALEMEDPGFVLGYHPPGRLIYFPFYVAGVKVTGEDEIDVEIASALTDARGKVLVSQTTTMKGNGLLLGTGPHQVCAAQLIVSQPRFGEYTFRVTFTDKLAGERLSFDRKLQVDRNENGWCIRFVSRPELKVTHPSKTQSGQPALP
jgi:hypothetical protein